MASREVFLKAMTDIVWYSPGGIIAATLPLGVCSVSLAEPMATDAESSFDEGVPGRWPDEPPVGAPPPPPRPQAERSKREIRMKITKGFSKRV